MQAVLVRALLEVFEPLGSDTIVSIRVCGAMAIVRLGPETAVARNMELTLRFDRRKLHLFHEGTRERIAALDAA